MNLQNLRSRQEIGSPFKVSRMTIFTSARTLVWGGLDVPLFGLTKDLQGEAIEPPAAFSVVADPSHLWLIASHRKPATMHPRSRPGIFLAELWRYDVAELFLSDPVSGRYFEFNVSPNGAWWSCEFTAPRVRAEEVDIAMPEVATYSEIASDGTWLAALAIPLHLLKARLNFGPSTRSNVTMILNSPDQKFLSAADLGKGEPNFHQPDKFTNAVFTPLKD